MTFHRLAQRLTVGNLEVSPKHPKTKLSAQRRFASEGQRAEIRGRDRRERMRERGREQGKGIDVFVPEEQRAASG